MAGHLTFRLLRPSLVRFRLTTDSPRGRGYRRHVVEVGETTVHEGALGAAILRVFCAPQFVGDNPLRQRTMFYISEMNECFLQPLGLVRCLMIHEGSTVISFENT